MKDLLSNDPNGEKYYTAAELSKVTPVRLHPGTIGRWADKGVRGHILRSMRFGGKRLFRRSDLIEFLVKINDEQLPMKQTDDGNSKMSAAVDKMLNSTKREKEGTNA